MEEHKASQVDHKENDRTHHASESRSAQVQCQEGYWGAQGTNLAAGIHVNCVEGIVSYDLPQVITIFVVKAVRKRSQEVTREQRNQL